MSERHYLSVGWDDRAKVKRLGARWCPIERRWYIPVGVDQTPFAEWLEAAPAAPVERAALPNKPVIRALRQDGQPYLLAPEAILNWQETDHPSLISVAFRFGDVLVKGDLAHMDRTYGAVMSCAVPP